MQPCQCRGSMGGVHASCVEAWVEYHRRNSFQGVVVFGNLEFVEGYGHHPLEVEAMLFFLKFPCRVFWSVLFFLCLENFGVV